VRPWEAWAFNVLNAVLGLSGGAYFFMKYLMTAEDPFAVVNHPWQPSMLAAHVVAAPLALVLFGIVLRSHVLAKLAATGRRGRLTGWASLLSFFGMALSGYLLQVIASPDGLRLAVVAHLATSVVFVLGYGGHLVQGWRLQRASSGVLPEEPARRAPAPS
jgi:hypothetical protein